MKFDGRPKKLNVATGGYAEDASTLIVGSVVLGFV